MYVSLDCLLTYLLDHLFLLYSVLISSSRSELTVVDFVIIIIETSSSVCFCSQRHGLWLTGPMARRQSTVLQTNSFK